MEENPSLGLLVGLCSFPWILAGILGGPCVFSSLLRWGLWIPLLSKVLPGLLHLFSPPTWAWVAECLVSLQAPPSFSFWASCCQFHCVCFNSFMLFGYVLNSSTEFLISFIIVSGFRISTFLNSFWVFASTLNLVFYLFDFINHSPFKVCVWNCRALPSASPGWLVLTLLFRLLCSVTFD